MSTADLHPAPAPLAVIFDVDGLLVDTEPCWTVAETELFARRGLPFGPEQKAMLIGRSLPAACHDLAVMFDDGSSPAALESELLTLVADALTTGASAMPGAHDLVDAVAARAPVAAASNSPRSLLTAALHRGGFTDRFPVALSADDVPAPKPAPDLYLTACAALAALPPRCLAFEDSRTGVRAAQAAGVPCIGVPSLPGVELNADWTVTSLADEGLLTWVRSWPVMKRGHDCAPPTAGC